MSVVTSPASSAADGGLQLWLAIARQTDLPRDQYREAHRAYMKDAVASGIIFASGPAADQHGEEPYGGVTVLRAASEDEARRVMDAEPYVRAGARTYELIAWDVRHGNYAKL